MSDTPAGWYPSKKRPGEERYWDGGAWTQNFRPIEDEEEAPVRSDRAIDSPYAPSPSYQSQQRPADSPWAPQNIVESVRTVASNKENQALGTKAVGGALIADGVIGFGERRAGIFGAIGMVFFGIVWLVVTTFIMQPFGGGNEIKAGETKIVAQVTDINWKDKTSAKKTASCAPIASFTVDGKSYTATGNSFSSPCGWNKGESVDVIYNKDQIAASARIDDSKTTGMFKFIFPAAGILLIIAGAWTFIVRAGSIGAGIYLLKRGKKQSESLNTRK